MQFYVYIRSGSDLVHGTYIFSIICYLHSQCIEFKKAQWLNGRVLDSRLRGQGFEPHLRHCVVVLEHDTFILAQYWFKLGRPAPV